MSYTTSLCVDMISCDSNTRRLLLNAWALSSTKEEALLLSIKLNFSGGGGGGVPVVAAVPETTTLARSPLVRTVLLSSASPAAVAVLRVIILSVVSTCETAVTCLAPDVIYTHRRRLKGLLC